MPFKEIPGLPGKVYIPEQNPDAPKKHDCPDCFSCQMCSDSRCRVCRRQHEPCRCRHPENPFNSSANPFLSIQNITIRMGSQSFFKNLSWDIYPNQHWAIVGLTGAGKSILVKAIQRKVPLSAGRIAYFFDEKASDAKPPRGYFERGEIIRVAMDENERDHFHQARWHSMEADASERVAAYLDPNHIYRRSPYEIIDHEIVSAASFARRDSLLQQMAAEYLLDRRMIHLSNGEWRKIKLIRALMQSPKLLIIENPLAGLDSASRQRMQQILKKLLASSETKIILVTTTVDDLPAGISHVICVSANQILAEGDKESILRNSSVQDLFAGNQALSKYRVGPLPVYFKEPPPGNEPVIEMKNVSVRYQKTLLLQDITWQVGTGEQWAIMGPNGAGKSTLLSLVLADNPQAYANDIKLFGKHRGSGESVWEIKQHIGWVAPELYRAYADAFSCIQVVCSGFFDSIGLYRKPNQKQLDAAARWMNALGLDHLSEHTFQWISEGEQRLILICRALVKSPPLLILDEPCMGLDNVYRQTILRLLDNLCDQDGVQLLYVTHRLDELPASIAYVLKLENGQIAAKGKRGEILDESSPVVYERLINRGT